MPYIVINTSNDFEPTKGVRYATIEQADAVAREIINRSPGSVVFTAQVIADYRGEVSITVEEPAPVTEEPAPEEPQA